MKNFMRIEYIDEILNFLLIGNSKTYIATNAVFVTKTNYKQPNYLIEIF